MSDFAANAGATLLHYIREQRALVERIARGEVYFFTDPRFDILLRHEGSKLEMLQNLAKDAGYEGKEFISIFVKGAQAENA